FPAGSNIEEASCVVGIAEHANSVASRIYPSPSNGVITLEITPRTSGHITIEVMDLVGRTVHSRDLGTRSAGLVIERMDLQQLPEGSYMIRTIVDGRAVSIGNV